MEKLRKWLDRHSGGLVEVVVHIIAWVLYLLFTYFFYIRQSESSLYHFTYMLGIVITDVPLFYYFYSKAIPQYLVGGKKSWLFTGLVILVLGIYPFSRFLIDQFLIIYFPDDLSPFTSIVSTQFWTVFLVRTLGGLFVIIMASFGKFTFDYFRNMRIRKELETQNLTSELAFLKSQINPHFLFNTLNNIHTLSFKQSPLAPDAIMQLSELMRYMIYESDTDFVPLEKEVYHLKSFIELQSLRFKADDLVSFNISGNVSRHQIAPLLLLPFIENAFKHGYQLNQRHCIKIDLKATEEIMFQVENPMSPAGISQSKDGVGGVGLENIKRRLELIYPGRYTLSIRPSSNRYLITLRIQP